MTRKVLLALLGILIAGAILALLAGIKLEQFSTMTEAGTKMVMPPEPVNAIEVRAYQQQPRVSAVGTAVAAQGIVLRTETEGIVRNVRFESGALVKAGDELVLLDADIELTQLREAQVAADWANVKLKRAQELSRSRNISKEGVDVVETEVKQTAAKVAYFSTLVAKKTLRAPFSGRLGIRRISTGQFVDKGTEVVSLQALDPIYVEFSLPQQRLDVLSEGLKVDVAVDAFPQQVFEGQITAIEPDIDVNTRSIRVQATLANPDGRLRPGMSVGVSLKLAQTETVLLVPATAIVHGPFGNAVFVIEPGEKTADGKEALVVRQQMVRLGGQIGDFVIVTEGLKQGEPVVSTGVFKLRNGSAVVIDNSLAPTFNLAPKPGNS